MKFRYRFFAASVLILVCLFSGCGVKVDTVLAADQSAKVELIATIHPVLQAYLKDLGGDSQDFFSESAIRKRLSSEKGLTVVHLSASTDKGIALELKVADIRQLLAGQSGDVHNAITVISDGGKHRLVLTLNRTAIAAFLGMGGNTADLKYLLPQDKALTAKQYQEQLNWALEEYGTATQLADMFKTSLIKLRLTVPGPVVSAKGFTIIDRQAGVVSLELNMVNLLTLHTNLVNEVVY